MKFDNEQLMQIMQVIQKALDGFYADRVSGEIDSRVQYHVQKALMNKFADTLESAVKELVQDTVLVEVKVKNG